MCTHAHTLEKQDQAGGNWLQHCWCQIPWVIVRKMQVIEINAHLCHDWSTDMGANMKVLLKSICTDFPNWLAGHDVIITLTSTSIYSATVFEARWLTLWRLYDRDLWAEGLAQCWAGRGTGRGQKAKTRKNETLNRRTRRRIELIFLFWLKLPSIHCIVLCGKSHLSV